VTDLARSLRFYVGALGFEMEYDGPETGFAALTFLGSPVMLEEWPSHARASDQEFEREVGRTGRISISRSDEVSASRSPCPTLIAWYAQVVDAGYSVKLGVPRPVVSGGQTSWSKYASSS